MGKLFGNDNPGMHVPDNSHNINYGIGYGTWSYGTDYGTESDFNKRPDLNGLKDTISDILRDNPKANITININIDPRVSSDFGKIKLPNDIRDRYFDDNLVRIGRDFERNDIFKEDPNFLIGGKDNGSEHDPGFAIYGIDTGIDRDPGFLIGNHPVRNFEPESESIKGIQAFNRVVEKDPEGVDKFAGFISAIASAVNPDGTVNKDSVGQIKDMLKDSISDKFERDEDGNEYYEKDGQRMSKDEAFEKLDNMFDNPNAEDVQALGKIATKIKVLTVLKDVVDHFANIHNSQFDDPMLDEAMVSEPVSDEVSGLRLCDAVSAADFAEQAHGPELDGQIMYKSETSAFKEFMEEKGNDEPEF